jgi:hypothetical protein
MTLAHIDQLVHDAEGRTVRLDAVPVVYLDEDGVTFDAVGDVTIPEPDDETYLYLLAERYPGVVFELPEDVPGFQSRDEVLDLAEWQRQRDLEERCDEPHIVGGDWGAGP